MIIELKNVEDANKVMQQVEEKKLEHVFQHNNRLGCVDQKALGDVPFEIENVEQVITDHPAAIQASRSFHPENTVIKTEHSVIGDGGFALIAGPDSIESAEHVLLMGKDVQESGATLLRGGSFKPRTNPYSFQGLGEEGLK